MPYIEPDVKELARAHFDNLDAADSAACDSFFGNFGPGNVFEGIDRPFERLAIYEEMLSDLKNHNADKYNQVHKGTPFYFMSWLAFDIHNYEKALYFAGASISEDQRLTPDDWPGSPSSTFLSLEITNAVAKQTVDSMSSLLDNEISRFNDESELDEFTREHFTNNFLMKLVQSPSQRTIVTAFYVFLLEFSDRVTELELRGSADSSTQPFIKHLFSGALIFESLLKFIYPRKNDGTVCKTLRDIFRTSHFRTDSGLTINGISAESLQEILDAIGNNSMETALVTTSKIRNTTGHNLVWGDIFENTENYRALVRQELNSLFYIISMDNISALN